MVFDFGPIQKLESTEQLLGKAEQPASTSRVGEVYAESLSNGPYTHRVHNLGNGLMDKFHVELFKRPAQPSTHAAAPVAAENASARHRELSQLCTPTNVPT
jgi:hypothetical protein